MLSKIYSFLHRLFVKPQERGEYSGGYWQDLVRRETLILCRPLSGRLLEVGCGEGLFLTQLARQNQHLEFWGVDNNPLRLKEAEKHFQENNLCKISLSLQEAAGLNFADEYFDAVICINVIFNLESRDSAKKVLEEAARVCKKNGKLVLDFRNSANPLMRIKYKLAPFYDQTVKHLPLKVYSLAELRLILEETGFVITGKIYTGFPIKSIAPIIILEAEKI